MIDMQLVKDENVEPGHQWILLPKTAQGIALAQILTGGFVLLADTRIRVAHTAEVDRRIVELVNLLAQVRFSAPDLVQLTLMESKE